MAPNINKVVRRALLTVANSAWEPSLARILAEFQLGILERDQGLTKPHNHTLRVFPYQIGSRNIETSSLAFPKDSRCNPLYDLSIDWLPLRQLKDLFGCPYPCYSKTDSASPLVLNTVAESFAILKPISGVADSIAQFVKSLHLIKPPDDDTDISFSDPTVPFAAFVSVPTTTAEEVPWRVAESILHEFMHLQLSAIENVVPLVATKRGAYYSPWRKEMRPVSGVLHGAYAFFGVNDFVLKGLRLAQSPRINSYLLARRRTLRNQFSEIQTLSDHRSLTPIGATFARNLIEHVLQPRAD